MFNSTLDRICSLGFLLDITYFNYSAFLVHGYTRRFTVTLLDVCLFCQPINKVNRESTELFQEKSLTGLILIQGAAK